MRTSFAFTFFLMVGFVFNSLLAQHYPACDSIQKNKAFTGFCREYLNKSMVAVKEGQGKVESIVLYEKGKKSKEYPNQFLTPTDKIYRNDTLLQFGEYNSVMNGSYTIKDKNGKVTENILYRDGFIIKHITRYESLLKKRKVGETVHEIAEYDYTVFPFVKHYIYYSKPAVIKDNYYAVYKDSSWSENKTQDLMSDTLSSFKSYGKKATTN